MCLALPMQIESIDGQMAVVNVADTRRRVSIAFLDEPKIGDYVLVHAGFAIKKIDEASAAETVTLLNELYERTNVRTYEIA